MLVRDDVEERLAGADADDEADQQQVDAEVASAATTTWARTSTRSSPRSGAIAATRDDRRDREHGGVVADADRRPVLEQLHDRRGETDDHAGLPAVEHDGSPCRRRSRARRRRCRCRRAGPGSARRASTPRAGPAIPASVIASRGIDGERDRGRRQRPRNPATRPAERPPRAAGAFLPPGSSRGSYQPQVKSSQPQFPSAAARQPRS